MQAFISIPEDNGRIEPVPIPGLVFGTTFCSREWYSYGIFLPLPFKKEEGVTFAWSGS